MPAPTRVPIPSLTQEYRDDLTQQRWDVRAYAVQPDAACFDGKPRPWSLRRLPTGTHDFHVVIDDQVFQSATLTPLDSLLAELAWWAMDFLRDQTTDVCFASVLASLRARYATASRLDTQTLAGNARITIADFAGSIAAALSREDARTLFEALPPADKDAIYHRMAVRSQPNPQEVISSGRFLEFAPSRTLLRFFREHPELFFDGRYFDVPYANLSYGTASATQEAQTQTVRYYEALLTDAVWLIDSDPADLSSASRARLLRASLALDLLDPSGCEGNR